MRVSLPPSVLGLEDDRGLVSVGNAENVKYSRAAYATRTLESAHARVVEFEAGTTLALARWSVLRVSASRAGPEFLLLHTEPGTLDPKSHSGFRLTRLTSSFGGIAIAHWRRLLLTLAHDLRSLTPCRASSRSPDSPDITLIVVVNHLSIDFRCEVDRLLR